MGRAALRVCVWQQAVQQRKAHLGAIAEVAQQAGGFAQHRTGATAADIVAAAGSATAAAAAAAPPPLLLPWRRLGPGGA